MTTHPLDELYEGMGDEDLRVIERTKEVLRMEVELLSTLRKDRDLTQQELAEILDVRQSAISQIERREDVLVGTLERYVQALGGELEIAARFPDRVVTILQFSGRAATDGTAT